MTAFETCLKLLLRHEGGYVNHPSDPGGMTNLGVTRRTWEAWVKRKVGEKEMRGLTLALVAPMYKQLYWDPVEGDKMPMAFSHCVFDFAVNGGDDRAERYVQRLVGALEDGEIGRKTLEALQAFVTKNGLSEAVRGYQNLRRAFYKRSSNFPTFGRGWLNRVDNVETEALRMIK